MSYGTIRLNYKMDGGIESIEVSYNIFYASVVGIIVKRLNVNVVFKLLQR